jgi:Ca2+-binding RTX toxin-like protein
MDKVEQAFLDAILSDIAYVDGFVRGMTGDPLRDLIKYRTPFPQAQEIGDRFQVMAVRDDAASDFQGVVFKDKVDGAMYVANRGTTLGQDMYDADLDVAALSGLARNQVAAMVNWWQDISSQPGANFTTIAAVPVGGADPRTFVTSGSKMASGLIATELAEAHAQGKVRVVGHSLGGHLATVLTSLFADQVDHSSTFNSAGLDSILALRQNLQNFFVGAPLQEAATLISRAIQLPGEGNQDNYFAANGLSLTTSDFVFRQLGRRIPVYNEYTKELVPPFYRNHSIYKQTDSLALFRAFEKLDPNIKLGALNSLAEAGSSSQPSSLESLLDGLRDSLLGPGLARTPVSDDGGDWGARNMPPQRSAYYANLKSLVEAQPFQDVIGKVDVVSLVPGVGGELASTAKTFYGDFVALKTLSPFAIHPKTDVADAASSLDAVWRAVHADDYLGWTADRNARLYGDTAKDFDFTDQWYADRGALLQWKLKLNSVDFISAPNARFGGGAPTWFDDRISGSNVWIDSPTGLQQAVMPIVRFGTGAAESDLDGQAKDDHLYGMDGADTIKGNGGNDYVEGNADSDTLYGNDGNDTLLGGQGDDYVSGDAGDDKLYGGQGIDTLEGGDGRDQLVGGSEVDYLRGGAGTDTLDGGPGNDLLTGGTGDDSLKGGDGSDSYILAADVGDDTIDDSDGLGEIRIGADRLIGGDALSAGLWHQTLGGKEVRYAFAPDASGRGDLLIQSSAGSTTVKHFRSGDLGIVLNTPGQQPIPLPTPTGSFVGTTADDNRLGNASHRPVLGFGANDRVQGLTGRDEVSGGGGDDIVEGGPGIDIVAGNGGNDAVFSDASLTEVQLRDYITTSATAPTAGSMPTQLFVATSEWLQGGLGDDKVVGADGNDLLFGGGGRDLLVGGAGHDLINGDDDYEPADITSVYVQLASGTGAPFDAWYSSVLAYNDSTLVGGGDEIHAGSGDDAVYGERGDDTIWGDDGNDTMSGGEGGDVLFGGNGDDRLAGDDYGKLVGSSMTTPIGDDYVDGGSGNDQIFGDGGDDTLLGGAGNDVIRGNNDVSTGGVSPTAADDGDDYINGGVGDDTLTGDSAGDTIIGGDGNDIMFGDSDATPVAYQGGDYLDGGAGSDYLRGYGGNDTLLGGDGNDQVTGDAGDDYIDVGTGDNAVSGGDGNDVIVAAEGATALLAGNNSLMGDAGDDWISGEGRLWGGDGNDTLTTRGYYSDPVQQTVMQGGNGNDTLNATFGGASMYGDAGDDVFNVGSGIAYMSGGIGSDTFSGGTGSDYAWGEDGDDQAVGGGGNDQLSGGMGNDRLFGEEGDDVIFGEEGDDTLAGGAGFNYLDGGAGNDRYLIDAADGSSTIIDTQGTNVIEFAEGITAAQLTFLQGIDQAGNDRYLVIDGAGGHGRGSVVIGGGLDATISTFKFSDGTSLSAQQARDLALAETARLRAQVQVRPLSLKGGDGTVGVCRRRQRYLDRRRIRRLAER